MSTINKLSIQGIRSFSPDQPQVIVFRKPLTLIVGSNGAGKTTIIECIKMGLTGELPPDANRGRSFIHDPKVNTNTETKAAIKLQFQTVNGKKCTVARQFTLAYKTRKQDAAPSYSMTSSSLTAYNERGEKSIISQRCMDIDKAVPQHMGISKAILENVIFVHQEDANWPLRESKVLKQKFDDIFSATRYSKALDTIKKLRKDKLDEMKDGKITLAEKKAQVEKRQDIQKKMLQQRNNIDDYKEQLQDYADNLAQTQQELDEMLRVNDEYEELKVEVQRLKASRDEMIRTREQLRETIDQNGEEYLEDDTDAKLQKWRDQLMRTTDENDSKIASKENDIEQKRVEMDQREHFLAEKTRERILLQREVEEHEEHLRVRANRVEELARQLDISQQDGEQVVVVQERCARTVQGREHELQQMKDAHRMELDTCRRKISDLRHKIGQEEDKAEELSNVKKQEAAELQQLRKKLERGQNLGDEEMAQLKRALAEDQEKQKRDRGQVDSYKSKIEQAREQERSVLSKQQALESEMTQIVYQQQQLNTVNSLRAQHKTVQERVNSERDRIETDARGAGYNGVFQSEDLEEDATAAANSAKTRLLRLETQRKSTQDRMDDLERQKTRKQTDLDGKTAKLAKARKTMRDNSDTSWPELIVQREQTIRKLELQAKTQSAAVAVYEEMLEAAKQQFAQPCHGCPVCERGFSNIDEYERFISKVDEIRSNSKEEDGSVSGEIETAKRMLQYCKTRESIWTDAQRIQNVELPDLESQLEKLHQEKNALEDNSAKLHEESDSNGLLELSAKGLYDKWDLYKREKANLDTLDKKLQDAKSEIAGVTVDKTMETVHDELRVVKEEAEDISAQVRSLFEKQSREEEHLRQLNNRIRSAESRLHEAERTKDAQKLDESRKLAIEANVPVLQTQIEEIQGRLQEYRGQLPSMDSDEAVLATQHGEKEAELDCELSKWRARLAELQTQAETIERYNRRRPEDELQRLEGMVHQKEQEREALKDSISKLESQCGKLRATVAERNTMLRNMQDVINFRSKERDIGAINKVITEKGTEMARIAPHHDWHDRKSKLQNKVQRGLGGKGKLEGGIAECERELRTLQNELKKYKDADKEYRNILITVKTLELGCADLEKYNQALDKALVSYHAEKMQEVNDIAKFLWDQTYKGQDIESIEIRADEAGKKSYNYRLLMRKGNAELDMRGRCSAGQKVLASLVIRLALAETFCLNCGILALDEPTTNLDVENVKSLCTALKSIVEQRRGQHNFQLIIITHDEDFISELARADSLTSTYYRVSRDDQSNASMIEEQDICDF